MPVETDLYDLLGVLPDATEADIKKAYRKKAKEHHPDKNPNDPSAAQKFQEMAAAYEILSESHSRTIYDTQGMDGFGPGGRGGGGMDAADLFAEFFNGGGMFSFDFGAGRGGASRRGKGQDSVIPQEVTLEDLYNGKTIKMNMEKEIVCSTCKGSGGRGSAKPKECSNCEGKGWIFIHTQISSGRIGTSRSVCSECTGEGQKIREKDRCKKCKGHKTVKEKTRQDIFIDKGMSDGQRIVLSGAGDQQPGEPAGDVIFVLRALPHDSFERSGNDLLTRVKITLSEALLGFSRILVTHLDGRGISVASPRGKILKNGACIILRNEGMPIYKHSDQKGNLYIIMDIVMPDEQWLRSADRQALAQLLPPKHGDLDPRPEVVDEADFEETDIVEFGEQEEDWEDDEEDEEYDDGMGPEPDCRPQ